MAAGERMHIKSYLAKSVDQALADARVELGDEAVLLNTRKVPATQTASAGYEVTFGVIAEIAVTADVVVTPPAVRAASMAAKASTAAAHVASQTLTGEKSNTRSQRRPQQVAAKLLDLHRELDEIGAGLPGRKPARAAAPPDAVNRPPVNIDGNRSQPLVSELARLHTQMDELQRLLSRSSRAHTEPGRSTGEVADIYTRLIAADVDAALAKDIEHRLEMRSSGDATHKDSRRLEAFLREELERRVPLAPYLGAEAGNAAGEGPVVVLVGPRGVGKTTTLAKLAVSSTRFGIVRPVRFLALALSPSILHWQLQTVAATYGIAFQEVFAGPSLARLIAEFRRRDALFLDIAESTGNDTKRLGEAAASLADSPNVDVHLVVPAYMKACDLRTCIEKYASFRPSKLLVTKADEAQALGSVYSEAARAGLKLSFISNGPGIPHDVQAVGSENLLSMGLDREETRAQRVA